MKKLPFILIILSFLLSLYGYWLIFAIPVFLIATIWLWVLKKPLKIKIIWSTLPIILWYPGMMLFLYLAGVIGMSNAQKLDFIIPEDYRGKFTIVSNMSCGQDVIIKNEREQLIFPNNGILLYKGDIRPGYIDHKYYFKSKSGELTEASGFHPSMFWESEENHPPVDEIGVFSINGIGNRYTDSTTHRFLDMYVCSKNGLESATDYGDNWGFDEKVRKLMKNCYSPVDEFILSFYPAFHDYSEFHFDMDNPDNSHFIRLRLGGDSSGIEDLIIIDSTQLQYKAGLLGELIQQINNFPFSSHEPHLNDDYLDGISISFERTYPKGENYIFQINIPNRKDFSSEYEIFDNFFKMLEGSDLELEYVEYSEIIKDYLDYGIPIRKISDDPLEYRFWGSISYNEKDTLEEFLTKLPSNRPIIFDVTNFPSMAGKYYPLFRKLNNEKEIIYLVDSLKIPRAIEKIGNCEVVYSKGG